VDKKLVILLALSILIIQSCATTRIYKPVSEWENDEKNKIQNNISYGSYINGNNEDAKYVVWTGVIKNIEVVENNDNINLLIVVEQRFYDWIEDFGMQPQHYFISKRSQGLFNTEWKLKKETDIATIKSNIGDMVVVYGEPKNQSDGSIYLKASYVRLISKKLVLEMDDFYPPDKYY
jgi:hypothetical protein